MEENISEKVLTEYQLLFEHYPELKHISDSVLQTYELIKECCLNSGKILACGNGGSAADSTHIVGELMKGFKLKRKLSDDAVAAFDSKFGQEGVDLANRLQGAIPAIALTDQTAISTALANDNGNDVVYAQQVFGYGRKGDVLIAISTSGNSKNVVNACIAAKTLGLKVISMTGEAGGRMKDLCDVAIKVPSSETYRIQEYHLPIYHALCAMIEAELFE